MKRFNLYSLILFLLGSLLIPIACDDDDDAGTNVDMELLDKAKTTAGFVYFENNSQQLAKSPGSAHSQAFLKTRYNAVAAGVLDGAGRIKDNAVFPEGSLVVKELINQSGAIELYAILWKQKAHKDADANGWVWGYVKPDGSVVEPAANKGKGCSPCHGQSGHIDYNLMNKYF